MSDFEVFEIVNILGFLLGLAFGAVAQKNQFCFSGSIKDYILTKSTMRGSSVVVAMLIGIISTFIVSSIYELDLTQTVYYKENINYFAIIIGGLLFGVGMMLSDGCSNRHLIKFAQGDINSLIVLVFIAIFGYSTAKGFMGEILNPLIINNETLINLSSYIGNVSMNIYVISILLLILLYILVKKIKRLPSLWDGVILGLFVGASWYITGVIGEESMERVIELTGITFVYPAAKTMEFFTYYQISELTFAISLVFGVLAGAFLMAKVNRRYSFGCTASKGQHKVKYNIIGGSLMGTGGIMAIGCTVGQGLTGMSTLAFSSLVAILSIFISATITALIMNKKNKLPMCFIFEWKDNTPDYQI
ncbi:YeeE/YedE family protein [Halarcobacter sp.]|uniref:YeeE/YedE family protein n=1 Tax=Halarcobacter sp. TaxID=2321133 RepID=UPI002AA72D9F|nr:YeeE/YedE family protein [Halarcobacter sp.]